MKKYFFLSIFSTLFAASSPLFAFKVGVTAGPHAVIMEKVKDVAKTKGLTVEIIEFNDFILPNDALNNGDLDANCYQHQPFLDTQIQTRGYKLISIGKTLLMPLGIYSRHIQALDALEAGDKIAIPNDPTNGARALLLLEKAGLIRLKKSETPSVLDIIENPKNLEIIELEAPQIPRLLEELKAAVINTDWVIVAGLDPSEALITEDTNSPYTNVIVVREGFENDKNVQLFLESYHSPEIKAYINEQFKGAVIAAW